VLSFFFIAFAILCICSGAAKVALCVPARDCPELIIFENERRHYAVS